LGSSSVAQSQVKLATHFPLAPLRLGLHAPQVARLAIRALAQPLRAGLVGGPVRLAALLSAAPPLQLKPAIPLRQVPLPMALRALYLVQLATRALPLLLLVNRVALGRRLRDALS